jgi:citrate lyase subunit beta/citryl-CoA lyase
MSDQPLITWLYSPASRRERILGAIEYAPDAVIYDLEDGVAPPDKAQARTNLAEVLSTLDPVDDKLPYLEVRVNSTDSVYLEEDLAMVRETPAIRSVRVPKVNGLDDLEAVTRLLPPGMRVHALIETALGIENLAEICGSHHVIGASLGEADLRAALRISGSEVISHIRSRLVIASAAGGKDAPMGSAYLNVHDHEGLVADTRRLAGQGFLGRTAVHPSQLEHIRAGFRPSQEDYAAAREVFDSVGGDESGAHSGASALGDGTFIDRPVIVRARQTIDLWEATG